LKTKDEIRDQRLWQKYGISLEEYNQMLDAQGGACAICRKLPKVGGKALHVEHDHKVSQTKVNFLKEGNFWHAAAEYNHLGFLAVGRSKSEASKTIRSMLKKAAVRGLTCWRCNQALQSFRDDPQLMRAAAAYLERFQHTSAVPPAPTSGENQ